MAENNTTTMSGLMKRVYGDKVVHLIPENALITKMFPWGASTKRISNKFYEAVCLSMEQGVTYAEEDSGGFAFEDAVAGSTKQAEVGASQIHIRARLDYETATNAMEAGSARAFEQATSHVIKNMTKSIRHRLELNFLYGGSDLGVVSGSPSGNVVTIAEASFGAGIWIGMENASVEFRDPTSFAFKASSKITAMDLSNSVRTLTLADATGVSSGDLIYLRGTYEKEAIGMNKIITTSGTLFGIDNASYNLWKGNHITSVGEVTQKVIDNAVTAPINKGYTGDLTLLVNPWIWADLLEGQNALRQHIADSKTMVNGAEVLKYRSQNGFIDVVSHPSVKIGDGFLITKKDWKRVGACDVVLGNPITKEAWTPLTENAAVQTECYSHQALFCVAPGFQTKLSGITKNT